MSTASQRPLLERLWMACVALLFLVQPIASAGNCTLRAKLLGRSCCCASAAESEQKPNCCSKRAGDEPPAQPAHKRCGCELKAPPLVPPNGTTQVPGFLGELARALELPNTPTPALEFARPLDRAHAPPGFASCFHARLDAGMARALAFERTLRC
jgi:hypothetical protein